MANVLKVVLKPLKVTPSVTPKATSIPLSTPVARNSTSELNVAFSLNAYLEGSVPKVCLITDTIKGKGKEEEKTKALEAEGSTEKNA
jgi:hypothetical protein